MAKDIFEYVLNEKNSFEAGIGVPVSGNWYWKMYDHNNHTLLMKNGQFPLTQTKLGDRPKKNIILPILNVAHRTEGFDVKQIEPFVNDERKYYKSLLARKFHTKWARKHSIDTFIDDVVEGLDYGYVLVKNVNEVRPVVVQPQEIAFCNQTNILGGTIALKYAYSVDELIAAGKEGGWYQEAIDRAVMAAREEKTNDQTPGQTVKIPDKNIEVFEVHGSFPEHELMKNGDENYNKTLKADSYCKQIHIITYIKDGQGNKVGVCLYKGRESKPIFKVLVINPVFGRAAGRGRVEELFEPQIWTDYALIHKVNMLRDASKVIQVTDDEEFTTRNDVKNAKGGEVWIKGINTSVQQLNTQPVNYQLFDNFIAEMEQHARTTGSASDPSLGLNPVSGTPLGTTQLVTVQGEGIHEYNRGKIAQFIGEIYRDWILPYLADEMNKGDAWIEELTLSELQEVGEAVCNNAFEDYKKELVLRGQDIPPKEEIKTMKDTFKQEFYKKGSKRFLEIMKDEFKDLPIDVYVNITNKQKDLARMGDKITTLLQNIIASTPGGFPVAMQNPGFVKLFNEALEVSGFSPVSNADIVPPQPQPTQQPAQNPLLSPLQPQLEANAT